MSARACTDCIKQIASGLESGWRALYGFIADYPLPCALWVLAFVLWLPR